MDQQTWTTLLGMAGFTLALFGYLRTMKTDLRGDLETGLARLESRMDSKFDAVDTRFEAVDKRFDAVDKRFDAVDKRFEGVDKRFDQVEARLGVLEQRTFDLASRLPPAPASRHAE